jgi:hypothetical protein
MQDAQVGGFCKHTFPFQGAEFMRGAKQASTGSNNKDNAMDIDVSIRRANCKA